MKTPDQLANAWVDEYFGYEEHSHGEAMAAEHGFLGGYRAGRSAAAPQWISVTDSLPEGYDIRETRPRPYVLVNDTEVGVHVAAYNERMQAFFTSATQSAYEEELNHVTHWMRIPEKP